MLCSRSSPVSDSSKSFTQVPRKGKDNLDWLAACLKGAPEDSQCHLILLGGRDALSVRLRVAQAHLRSDLTPSHWSHVVLRTDRDEHYHIPLATERGFAFPPRTNGVQPAELGDYGDPRRFPNVAVIHVPHVE